MTTSVPVLLSFSLLFFFSFGIRDVKAQYEDVRCKCICPDTAVVNGTQSHRKLYIENVPPNKCDCTNVVLPRVGDDIKGKEKEFCPRCECKYESRNTTTIKVVVIIVIWIISLLVIYMLFLVCLDPLLNKKTTTQYQEHNNEEDESETHSQPLRASGAGVLNRVGQTTDKWKKTVQEQRRHIYDRHTILN
ncbi:uncharacterized protein CG1161 [Daphnia magna]|uniref:Transmembrane protein 9 n=2 Tax=Daphnia magna TaxID=35525 RepID=A0A0P5ZIB1_9CRUS|nr:uncharacterized protein CG1161 [Daphnia magna]KAK4007918.1 hypothetical protein OUZ56_013079 [Daphnia magna]KZS15356.1 Transmembrane protein 9 [Daphnia magna]